MTLDQIKAAVQSGQTVRWDSDAYEVVADSLGQWFIRCTHNNHCIGLTWADGVTLNGKPEQFYVAA